MRSPSSVDVHATSASTNSRTPARAPNARTSRAAASSGSANPCAPFAQLHSHVPLSSLCVPSTCTYNCCGSSCGRRSASTPVFKSSDQPALPNIARK